MSEKELRRRIARIKYSPEGEPSFDSQELKWGEEVEKEHERTYDMIKSHYDQTGEFPSPEVVYRSIAEDHLMEFSDYYTRLLKMEKEAEEELSE